MECISEMDLTKLTSNLTEIEAADLTCHLTQSQSTHTKPANPTADLVTPVTVYSHQASKPTTDPVTPVTVYSRQASQPTLPLTL